jgi:hypothetical protein
VATLRRLTRSSATRLSARPIPQPAFTFSAYGGPIAASITSATLEIGLYDGASPSPSTAVQFFTLNGIDNVLTAALVAHPAQRRIETYYTLTLPSTDFSALATGSSTFALGLQGQGEGVLGPTTFNAFGLDFALTINTTPGGTTWTYSRSNRGQSLISAALGVTIARPDRSGQARIRR